VDDGDRRSRLLRRWEALPARAQLAIVFPIASLVLWVGHVTLLNQPRGRGFLYGIFWGAILAVLVVYATQNEVRKRRAREEAEER
jgi:hypothetical protein